MTTPKLVIVWVLRCVAVFIMGQSLFFKFSAAEESVYIFTTLGMEPAGRIGTGIVELIASILLLIPRTSWIGAGMGIATMSGAIFFHLTKLGIEINGDGGQLFLYAIIAFASCLALILIEKEKIQQILPTSFSK